MNCTYDLDSWLTQVNDPTKTYTAPEFDSETSLCYYRARYYDPSPGRFISEDPIRFKGGINFYEYTLSNPVNLSDPTGLVPNAGVGPEGCSYYDKRCANKCAPDDYSCRAASCCRSFGNSPKANCTRACLIRFDEAHCSHMGPEQRPACRMLAHGECYQKCRFFPNLLELPASCWSIADGK
jgi:RHS repeat-associated protein